MASPTVNEKESSVGERARNTETLPPHVVVTRSEPATGPTLEAVPPVPVVPAEDQSGSVEATAPEPLSGQELQETSVPDESPRKTSDGATEPARQVPHKELPSGNTGGQDQDRTQDEPHRAHKAGKSRKRAAAEETAPARAESPSPNRTENPAVAASPSPAVVEEVKATPVFDLPADASGSLPIENTPVDREPTHARSIGHTGIEHGAGDQSVRDARAAHLPRLVPNAAWLRNLMNQEARAIASTDGWNVLEMKLDEEGGTMTLKAKREEGQMSVTVGFSDPMLRTLAQANLPQLKEALQAQYDAPVEFSLSSDGSSGGTGEFDNGNQPGRHPGGTPQPGTTRKQVSTLTSLVTGALHEWIG